MQEFEIEFEIKPSEFEIDISNVIRELTPPLIDLEVDPISEKQVFKHDGEYGYDEVIVNPISSEYIKPSGTLDITVNGEYDVKSYEKANVKVGEVEKGLVINEYGSDGYPTDVSIVGMTEIPQGYLTYAGYKNGLLQYFLSKVGANFHLPDNLVTIGNYGMGYCTTFQLTKLPDTIISIGDYGLVSNEEMLLTKLPDNLQTIGNHGLDNCKKMNLSKLPSLLTSIGDYGLKGCIGLIELDVLSTVLKKIGNYAFRQCSNLTKIIFRATTPPTLGSSAFQYTPIESGTGYIYVPDESLELYKKATNWSTYADQIKGLSELEG